MIKRELYKIYFNSGEREMNKLFYPKKRTNVNIEGFSLMELMIVVSIIGILTAIAMPNYTDYIQRGQRAEGRAALTSVATILERFYSDNNQFTTVDDTFPPGVVNAQRLSETGLYTLNIAIEGTRQTYTLSAVPTSFIDLKCGTLTLESNGTKGQDAPGTLAECWQK
jgi:type IV pilus assembly protein PilE